MLGLLSKKPSEDDGDTRLIVLRYDRPLLAVTLLLMGFGVVMVYSASGISAERAFHNTEYYLARQALFVGIALTALLLNLIVHHDLWRRLAAVVLVGSLLLLAITLIPGVATSAKGAARWIAVGPFRIQPSEFIKLAWIIFLAERLSRLQANLNSWKTAWLVPCALMAVIGVILMAQKDFGTTVICAFIMVLMVWAAGGRNLHVAFLITPMLGLLGAAIIMEPYRVIRFLIFLDPESDVQGAGYHINQALISFGSGDWFGLGLGASRQKLLFLPEAHTDFIFSIIGEELGLIGAVTVMVVFAIFVIRGFTIARKASTAFGALLAFGITGEIGTQAMVNMGVATALLPTKGLTLPFISYGGSSLLVLGISVGMLLSISKRQPPPLWMHQLFEKIHMRLDNLVKKTGKT